MFNFKRILVLNSHADDAEVNCGGTIINLINSGCEVYYACFSLPKPLDMDEFTEEDIKNEMKNAIGKLGIKSKNLFFFDYPIRRFSEKRQNLLDDLINIKNKIKPDVVFCHSSFDVHQDHRVMYEETVRAFKDITILGYESHWNQVLGQNNRVFVPISEEVFNQKMKAIAEYKSQTNRNFFSKESQSATLKYHGLQIKEEFCEVFECIRMILRL